MYESSAVEYLINKNVLWVAWRDTNSGQLGGWGIECGGGGFEYQYQASLKRIRFRNENTCNIKSLLVAM